MNRHEIVYPKIKQYNEIRIPKDYSYNTIKLIV